MCVLSVVCKRKTVFVTDSFVYNSAQITMLLIAESNVTSHLGKPPFMPVINKGTCFASVDEGVLSLEAFEFSDFAVISGHFILWVNMNTRNLEFLKRQCKTNNLIREYSVR